MRLRDVSQLILLSVRAFPNESRKVAKSFCYEEKVSNLPMKSKIKSTQLTFQQFDDVSRADPLFWLQLQTPFEHFLQGRVYFDSAVTLLLQKNIQVLQNAQLLFYDPIEFSALNCKSSLRGHCLSVGLCNYCRIIHPQRNSVENFQKNAAETPNIDDPRVAILFNELDQFRSMSFSVFLLNEREKLRTHILRSGHRKLIKMSPLEYEARAVVNKLAVNLLAFPYIDQDILSLQVGVHYVILAQQFQGLAHLEKHSLQYLVVAFHPLHQRLVAGLVEIQIYMLSLSQLPKRFSKTRSASLIDDPGVLEVDFVGDHAGNRQQARMSRKLLFGMASQLEEISTEPNLLLVSLLLVRSQDLFNSELLSTADVHAEPNSRKAALAQQLHFLEALRKSVPIKLFFLLSQLLIQLLLVFGGRDISFRFAEVARRIQVERTDDPPQLVLLFAADCIFEKNLLVFLFLLAQVFWTLLGSVFVAGEESVSL